MAFHPEKSHAKALRRKEGNDTRRPLPFIFFFASLREFFFYEGLRNATEGVPCRIQNARFTGCTGCIASMNFKPSAKSLRPTVGR